MGKKKKIKETKCSFVELNSFSKVIVIIILQSLCVSVDMQCFHTIPFNFSHSFPIENM